MRRFTLRFIIALLTFIIGVTAVSLWFVLRHSSLGFFNQAVNPPVQTLVKSERTYQRGAAGQSTEGSFITLISSHGMSFTKWTVYCRTPQLATKELQKRLNKATEIISREPVLDKGGQQVGEKILVGYSVRYPNVRDASLIWTEKEWLYQVDSSTLQNILEYRKDFKR
jgi:hypothetical protein